MKFTRILALTLALLIAAPIGAGQYLIYKHHLKFVPEAFQIWRVTYVSEQSWGWGPGGGDNATGLIVHAMPDAVFDKLQSSGIEYLDKLPFDPRRCCEGRYEKWMMTPVDTTVNAWKASSAKIRELKTPKIGDYLDKWISHNSRIRD